jgi:hypothetical protein
MRHFVGVLLALAVAAMLFFGAAWGVARILALRGTVTGTGTAHALTSASGLTAVGLVVATGLVIGILLVARPVSPLATGLPGLVLLAWSAMVVVHSKYAGRYLPLPGSHFAEGFTYLLFNGVLALLGAVMIVPLAVPSRWRRHDSYVDDRGDEFSVHEALGLTP